MQSEDMAALNVFDVCGRIERKLRGVKNLSRKIFVFVCINDVLN